MMSLNNKSENALPSWLHAQSGPYTRELVQEPARFGLGMLPIVNQPTAVTTTVCGFCSTGCGLNVHLTENGPVNLSPATAYPVNLGMACPKGWEALSVLNSSERATTPLLRNSDGVLQSVSWPVALQVFRDRLQAIQAQHGNSSVAFLSTGQIATEEMMLLGALAKFGMGIVHCDSNTRQCMATSHVAYKQAFGFDAPPFTYADFEESDLLIFIGANPCIAHPIIWERVMRNQRDPYIVVIDPRRTETAMQANEHFAVKPKGDLALLYAIAQELHVNGWIDREFIAAHTDNYEEFAKIIADYTPESVATVTGISASQICSLAQRIHERKRVSIWWTMGVNQSHQAVRTAQAIINLCLMTGNIGKPGTGPNSITGQCNAMGSRIMANITSMFGGRDFLNADHRAEIAELLNIDETLIPQQNSWPYHKIIEGILSGEIRGLWVIATNPAHSWIHQNLTRELLDKLEFLVVQDMYSTNDTIPFADLVLPAAGWGEKDGTLINSERRIGRIKKVARAPGQALSDFAIFRAIAEVWGCGDLFREWSSPEAAFQIMKRLSAGRPCDITGITDYDMLDECGGVQWPFTKQQAENSELPATERRLFADGRFFTPSGRAKFIAEPVAPVAEAVDKEFPLTLLTGRGTVAQWHTNTRTKQSAILRKLYPEQIYVEIHPDTAESLDIEPWDEITITSRRGKIIARACVTNTVQCDAIFLPMHYEAVNQLTNPSFDPHSYQPSYKHCAVRVSAVRESRRMTQDSFRPVAVS